MWDLQLPNGYSVKNVMPAEKESWVYLTSNRSSLIKETSFFLFSSIEFFAAVFNSQQYATSLESDVQTQRTKRGGRSVPSLWDRERADHCLLDAACETILFQDVCIR